MLKVKDIKKSFDGVKALRGVNMDFQAGRVYAIIGPNGAGKTTLLNIINGFIKPDKGSIFIRGKDVTSSPPYQMARMGVGRLFQDIRVFPRLKVMDNLLLPKEFEAEENPLAVLTRAKANREKERTYREASRSYLKEVGISAKENSYAEDLSYGQEKLLSFGRLLMGDFEILLLDEPVAGVNPHIKEIIYREIKKISSQGKLAIIVEHEMEAIRRVADWVYFISQGEVAKSGPSEKVLEDKGVVEEYIGYKGEVLNSEGEMKGKPITAAKGRNLLTASGVYANYYKREILHGVDIQIREKEIVALIGPNGAGKSTLLKVLAGVLPVRRGRLIYDNEDITSLSPQERVRKGMGYFIQGGEVFTDLNVEENLNIAALNMPKGEIEEQRKELYRLFPVLKEKRKTRAGLLSGGERQMLALGMILMRRPKVLLWLDEPSAGLSPRLTTEMLRKIRDIREMLSTSILLVEQRIGEALTLADRVYIMKGGELIKEVLPNELDIEKIEAIYMGNHNGERKGFSPVPGKMGGLKGLTFKE